AHLAVVRKGGLLLRQELLDRGGLLREVRRDADHAESPALVRLLQPGQVRELLAAGHAPGGPEVDQDDFPLLPRDRVGQTFRVDFAGSPTGLRSKRRENEKGGHRRPLSADRRLSTVDCRLHTRLIVQPNAFVSAFAISLPASIASRAFFKSGFSTFEGFS